MMIGNAVSYVAAAYRLGLAAPAPGRPDRSRRDLRTLGKVLRRRAGSPPWSACSWSKLLPGDDTPSRLEAIVQLVIGGAVIGGTYLGLACCCGSGRSPRWSAWSAAVSAADPVSTRSQQVPAGTDGDRGSPGWGCTCG